MSIRTEPRSAPRDAPAPAAVLRTVRSGAPAGQPHAVVIVHPGALPTSVYERLVAALPATADVHLLDLQAVEGYQRAAFDGGRAGTGVEQIAASFTEVLLRQLRPGERPVLVGWSFGGVVAHLMTGPLAAAGAAPSHLVLLDSIAPVPGYLADVEDLSVPTLLAWFAMYLATKRGRQPHAPLGDLHDLTDVLDTMVRCGALLPGTTPAGLAKVYDAYVDGLRRNTFLTRDLTVPAAAVPTTVVRARRSLLAEEGPLGWDRVCPPGLRVLAGEGDHYSMLADPTTTALVAQVVRTALAPV